MLVETAFGQTEFGQYHIWPKLSGRIWPTIFGRIWPIFVDRIWPDRIWPFFFGGVVGCLRGAGPGGCGPGRVGARRVGGPKFRFFFFSLSCRKFHSSGGLLVEFWWFGQGAQMCAFGLSGCRVKPRGRWGFTRQPENSKRAHFRDPALQTPLKFNEKTQREREKKESGGKKNAKFRVSHPSAEGKGGPAKGWCTTHPTTQNNTNLGSSPSLMRSPCPIYLHDGTTTATTHVIGGRKRLDQFWRHCAKPKIGFRCRAEPQQPWLIANRGLLECAVFFPKKDLTKTGMPALQ